MNYKTVYVTYMSGDIQKQFAFISEGPRKVDIRYKEPSKDGVINKNISMPLIQVRFFDTLDEAIKDAETYCYYECICGGIYIYDPEKKKWEALAPRKKGECA